MVSAPTPLYRLLGRAALVAMLLPVACLAAGNIIANPDMELGGKASSVGWNTNLAKGEYEFSIAGDAHSGRRCLAIKALGDAGWARWYNTDLYLVQGGTYHLSVWVKNEGDASAQVWLPDGTGGLQKNLAGPSPWVKIEGDFTASTTGRYGIYLQSMGRGTVYFDDISLEMMKAPPATETGATPTDGAPIGAIVTPDVALPHHVYLSLDTQRILKQMTGQAPAVVAASAVPADDARRIWIGVAPPGTDYKAQLAKVGEEGIVLDIGPKAVVCLGNTPRGVYYAVQELYRVLGCRWCWPGPLGEIIPKVDRLSLPPRTIVHRPSFELRGSHIVQVYHNPPKYAPEHVNTEDWVDWAARNRMNRLKASYATTWEYGAIRGGQWTEIAGHSLYTILPPDKWFKSHPEFYPLVAGKRTAVHSSGRAAEVCVSNPEVARAVADYIIDYFASHPDAKRFCVNAEDEPSYWCECDQCKALDTKRLDWSKNGVETMDLTDRWMFFINRVAELVEKVYPDRIVSTFAYASTRELPHKYLPRRNVMIELTWWDECFKHATNDRSCPINAKGMERFNDWRKLAPVALYRYLDYWHNEAPQPYFHAEADILRTTWKGGCRHLSDEWDTTFTASALLLNLRARLEWDVNTDVDAFIDDFCAHVYGKAGADMARYYRRLERGVIEAPTKHVGFTDLERFTPTLLKDCHALLDTATGEADNDDIAARIDRQRYALLFAELEQVSEAAAKNVKLYARQAELQERIWGIVQRRKISPILGAYGKLGVEYKPPIAAMTGKRLLEMPENWSFKTDPQQVGDKERWSAAAPDASWKPISIHKCWEEQGYPGYDGDGWYTVEVTLPAVAKGRVWLFCEAVDETFKLWINGQYVGASEGDPAVLWDKPVAVEITGKYKPGATNRVTMKVHDSGGAGGIWKPVWVTASE